MANKSPVTGRQLLTIAALAAVLAGVLIWQFGGAKTTSPAAADAPQGPRPKPAAASPEARPWPKLTLQQAWEHDPFAPPPALAKKVEQAAEDQAAQKRQRETAQRRQEQETALAALRAKGTTVVLRGPQGNAALMGNRTVRPGDVVDGFRVVSIDSDGVLLAPANPP